MRGVGFEHEIAIAAPLAARHAKTTFSGVSGAWRMAVASTAGSTRLA